MKFTKPAIDIKVQIAQLKKRGLIIQDENFAEHHLRHISYYRLAGYWWPLQSDKLNHLFKPNSKFETVVKLYKFDSELRKLLFEVIEEIEIAFRSKLIYHLSHEFNPWWFEDVAHFQIHKDHSGSLVQITRDLSLNRKKEVFLTEHYKKYHTDTRNPPAWKTLEVLSLGTLSKIYGNLANKCKSKDLIAAEFGCANFTYFHSWMQDLTQIRNMCAHHGRIWNKNLPGRPKLLPKPPNAWLKKVPPASEHHMLYVHLCCMKYLLNVVSPNNNFSFRLYVLLKHYDNIDLKALGMPTDWHKEPLWRNKIKIKNIVTYLSNRVAFLMKNWLGY